MTTDAYAPERTRYLGAWVNRSACRDNPHFDLEPENQAKLTCAGCPVIRDCGKWVINDCTGRNEPDGVIAAMTRDERAQVRVELHRRRATKQPPKQCTRCGETKDTSEFGVRSSVPTGLASECSACHAKASRERKARIREEKKAAAAVVEVGPEEKPCTRCGDPKPLLEFWANKRSPGGRESVCRGCRGNQQRIHRNGIAA